MAISIQSTVVVPNAVYTPQIIFQMNLNTGKPITSATIFFAGAKVDNEGQETENWQAAAQNGRLHIPDIMNLPSDLSVLQPQVAQVYAQLVALIDEVNKIRKVL
jgi:hypothetical protein